MEDAIWWSEYGCPFDAYSVLPANEYRAHLAILEGRSIRIREEQNKRR